MPLINLTPHAITLRPATGGELVIPPSGTVARIVETPRSASGYLEAGVSVPIYAIETGVVTGLPAGESCDGSCGYCGGDYNDGDCPDAPLYIVSRPAAEAARGRTDVLVVDDVIRDEDGNVIAARRLARLQTCAE